MYIMMKLLHECEYFLN